MQRFILRILATAFAVLLASRLLGPENLVVRSFEQALVFALVLGVLNAFVRPVLLLISLPLTLLTLGLFTLVVNAVVFYLATLTPVGVEVPGGFSAAFLSALIVTAVSYVASRFLR